jgi:phosphoribosylformylglycinamidine synthase
MGRLNICSFDYISYQYDHEVQGNSVIKPLQGKGKVNGNASVIRPLLDSHKGVALSQGIYPVYSDIDTYHMAACSIDTAVRNIISVGGTLERIALLDNFCWCDSHSPERLGQLKEAARACYDYSVAYGTPFISGKDSMFNDFKGYDEGFNEVFISVPPTLLISSTGVVEDIRQCVSLDFKVPGDLIYIIGDTKDETGGSEYLAYIGEKISGSPYLGNNIPKVDAESFSKRYRAYERAVRSGYIASAMSLERGGFAAALAKSAMGGLLGCEVDLSLLPSSGGERMDTLLFSETQGRILVSIDTAHKAEFEGIMSDIPISHIGEVVDNGRIVVESDGSPVIDAGLNELTESYRSTFDGF